MSDTRARIIKAVEQNPEAIDFDPRTIRYWKSGEGLDTTVRLVDAGILHIAEISEKPAAPVKEIAAVFALIGRRRKLTGFEARYNGQVIGTFGTRDAAQAALNAAAYDLLRVA